MFVQILSAPQRLISKIRLCLSFRQKTATDQWLFCYKTKPNDGVKSEPSDNSFVLLAYMIGIHYIKDWKKSQGKFVLSIFWSGTAVERKSGCCFFGFVRAVALDTKKMPSLIHFIPSWFEQANGCFVAGQSLMNGVVRWNVYEPNIRSVKARLACLASKQRTREPRNHGSKMREDSHQISTNTERVYYYGGLHSLLFHQCFRGVLSNIWPSYQTQTCKNATGGTVFRRGIDRGRCLRGGRKRYIKLRHPKRCGPNSPPVPAWMKRKADKCVQIEG